MPRDTIDLYIGNTDHDWFDFCSQQRDLTEVNFWQPSAQPFKVMTEGGIFFFRRKAPIGLIGGFGTLVSAEKASIGLLWDELGTSNGVSSEEEFIQRVKKYRNSQFVDRSTLVGFKILADPVFLDEENWFELPDDWSPNIVTGKGYSSSTLQGERLLSKFQEFARLNSRMTESAKAILGFSEPPVGGFRTSESKQRIGQGRFRLNLLSAYGGRCAITGCDVAEVLVAAHIRSFASSIDHSTQNGLLMRQDIHSLFDNGLLYIDAEFHVRLSEKFKLNYGSSSEYRELDGRALRLPRNKAFWPSVMALEEHRKLQML